MASAPPARSNVIADALVRACAGISKATDPLEWLTTPVTVKRGLLIGDLTSIERPRLSVQVLSIRTSSTLSVVHSDGVIRLGVHIIEDGRDGEKAEEALNSTARDVQKAVALDPTLGGNVTDCQFQEYVPQVEAMERTGLGIATVVFEAIYVWAHAAP